MDTSSSCIKEPQEGIPKCAAPVPPPLDDAGSYGSNLTNTNSSSPPSPWRRLSGSPTSTAAAAAASSPSSPFVVFARNTSQSPPSSPSPSPSTTRHVELLGVIHEQQRHIGTLQATLAATLPHLSRPSCSVQDGPEKEAIEQKESSPQPQAGRSEACPSPPETLSDIHGVLSQYHDALKGLWSATEEGEEPLMSASLHNFLTQATSNVDTFQPVEERESGEEVNQDSTPSPAAPQVTVNPVIVLDVTSMFSCSPKRGQHAPSMKKRLEVAEARADELHRQLAEQQTAADGYKTSTDTLRVKYDELTEKLTKMLRTEQHRAKEAVTMKQQVTELQRQLTEQQQQQEQQQQEQQQQQRQQQEQEKLQHQRQEQLQQQNGSTRASGEALSGTARHDAEVPPSLGTSEGRASNIIMEHSATRTSSSSLDNNNNNKVCSSGRRTSSNSGNRPQQTEGEEMKELVAAHRRIAELETALKYQERDIELLRTGAVQKETPTSEAAAAAAKNDSDGLQSNPQSSTHHNPETQQQQQQQQQLAQQQQQQQLQDHGAAANNRNTHIHQHLEALEGQLAQQAAIIESLRASEAALRDQYRTVSEKLEQSWGSLELANAQQKLEEEAQKPAVMLDAAAANRELQRLRILMRFSELKKDSDLLPDLSAQLRNAQSEAKQSQRDKMRLAAQYDELRRVLVVVESIARRAYRDEPQQLAYHLLEVCHDVTGAALPPRPTASPHPSSPPSSSAPHHTERYSNSNHNNNNNADVHRRRPPMPQPQRPPSSSAMGSRAAAANHHHHDRLRVRRDVREARRCSSSQPSAAADGPPRYHMERTSMHTEEMGSSPSLRSQSSLRNQRPASSSRAGSRPYYI